MKKRFNAVDINQKHGNELARKLYRTITEESKRLDDAKSCIRSIKDLFSPNLITKRQKLSEYCEKLIFSEPTLYGKKGEELLWRKVFYDVVYLAKKLKKSNYTEDEESSLTNHIYSGVGFYHHMISKLQTFYNITLQHETDFSQFHSDIHQNLESNKESLIQWSEQSLHQCLIYLGDLNRYKLEILRSSDITISVRYYMQAISYKPEYGMPYNQMGTLAMSQDYHLEAVYHYMRCLACKYSFEGTINNLITIFDKNSKYLEKLPLESNSVELTGTLSKSECVKRFLARFLLLIDIWFFNKNVPKVYNLCHSTFKDLDICFSQSKPSSESGDNLTEIESSVSEENDSLRYLTSEMFKITVICLICIEKLQSKDLQYEVSTITAFTLAIYSQLIQKVINNIEVNVLNYPLAGNESLSHKRQHSKIKLRRRKHISKNLNHDSESSDDDLSISSSDESFICDQENILAESSEEEVETLEMIVDDSCYNVNNREAISESNQKKDENHKNMRKKIMEKIQKMDVDDMIEIISEEILLHSIKILNDWLMMDSNILKLCGSNTPSLFSQLTYLLNLININLNDDHPSFSLVNSLGFCSKVPLPEDIVLRGLIPFSNHQKSLDWTMNTKGNIHFKEEAVARIYKLREFGKFLTTIPEMGISFNDVKNLYVCDVKHENNSSTLTENVDQGTTELAETSPNEKAGNESASYANNSKGKLIKMKHMGQLWLASEVTALENRVKEKPSLSPYLVLDADALIKYTFMVKHLIHSRKFIVLVPNAVVSALDDLKRERSEARDVIRWLETQFHRGNRFFRSQRPQERASIPFIKYPKKKDKEMSTYIQIIECCYYLSEQQKGVSNLVTLLIGNHNLLTNGENKEFSYVGLAQTAGISIESITQFYARSKRTSKEKR